MKRILIISIFIAGLLLFFSINTINLKNNKKNKVEGKKSKNLIISQIPSLSPSSTPSPTLANSSSFNQIEGARLSEIKYILPEGWEAEIRRELNDLFLQFTHFTPVKIGNISGYKADGLDNSGGGVDFFGVKGDKFYIINKLSPSSPNNFFERTYQQVLDSLQF